MHPVVCMITPPTASIAGDLFQRIEAAARAGAHLIQIRQRELEALALMRIVEGALDAIRGTSARVLVNDRVDVAIAAGAHGVHLRGDSMPARRVRGMTSPGFLVGRSVHSVNEAVQVEQDGGLDYLLFGTVFQTPSKPGVPSAGVDELSRVCGAVALPVLAIGGMTRTGMPPVARAGAAGFAAIGLFADPIVDEIPESVAAVCAAFDAPQTASLT